MTSEQKAKSLIGKRVLYHIGLGFPDVEGVCIAAAGDRVKIEHGSNRSVFGYLAKRRYEWFAVCFCDEVIEKPPPG